MLCNRQANHGPLQQLHVAGSQVSSILFNTCIFEAKLERKFFPHTHIIHMLNKSISVQAPLHGMWHCWGRKLRLPSPASHHHSPLQDLHLCAPVKCIYSKAGCASSPSYAELLEKHTFLSSSDPVLPGLILNCWQSNPSYSTAVSHIPGAWWAC